jgi:hypothetical protein
LGLKDLWAKLRVRAKNRGWKSLNQFLSFKKVFRLQFLKLGSEKFWGPKPLTVGSNSGDAALGFWLRIQVQGCT